MKKITEAEEKRVMKTELCRDWGRAQQVEGPAKGKVGGSSGFAAEPRRPTGLEWTARGWVAPRAWAPVKDSLPSYCERETAKIAADLNPEAPSSAHLRDRP